MDKHFFNDQWIVDDPLGIGETGDYVAKMLLQVPPPFSLGVIGKWGAGKTSIMRRAFATLKGRPLSQAVPMGETALLDFDVEEWDKWSCEARRQELQWEEDLFKQVNKSLCVWYSPWQHQGCENPLVPLLKEIQSQFSVAQKIKKVTGENFRRTSLAAFTLMERVIDAALTLKINKNVKITSGITKEIVGVWRDNEDKLTQLSDGQRFHLLFEDAISTLLSCSDDSDCDLRGRIIIFIDDLDRCEEEVIVSLLEAIKLYLGTKHCVFVLGMDDNAIMGALNRHWGNRGADGNREYLEKLLQCTLPIPQPRTEKIIPSLARIFNIHKMPQAHLIATDVGHLLEQNPRKIKNFANGLCARWGMLRLEEHCRGNSEEQQKFMRRFVAFQYIRQFHPSIWRLLERQRWSLEILRRVLLGHNEADPLSYDVDPITTHVMFMFMQREFSHVLSDKNRDPKNDQHLGRPLEKVLDGLMDRLDRKRSDDYLISMFGDLFQEEHTLDECFLSVCSPQPDEA